MSVRFFFICAGVSSFAFFYANQAEASRKADIIRRLHEQDRLEEGEKYCDKWLAVESPPADLREQCAEVFYQGVDPQAFMTDGCVSCVMNHLLNSVFPRGLLSLKTLNYSNFTELFLNCSLWYIICFGLKEVLYHYSNHFV